MEEIAKEELEEEKENEEEGKSGVGEDCLCSESLVSTWNQGGICGAYCSCVFGGASLNFGKMNEAQTRLENVPSFPLLDF